jgi:bifunctional DNase/RNase
MVRTMWMLVVTLVALVPLHTAGAGVSLKGRPGEVEMRVREVRYDRGSHVVILQTRGGGRLLMIWIGQREAQAIQMRMSGAKAPRPLTHDLLETVLSRLKARIVKVEVDDLKNNVFYGKLTLKDGTGRHRIDGRPSDLITLAVGANLPIHVAAHVLKKAGVDAQPAAGAGKGPQGI